MAFEPWINASEEEKLDALVRFAYEYKVDPKAVREAIVTGQRPADPNVAMAAVAVGRQLEEARQLDTSEISPRDETVPPVDFRSPAASSATSLLGADIDPIDAMINQTELLNGGNIQPTAQAPVSPGGAASLMAYPPTVPTMPEAVGGGEEEESVGGMNPTTMDFLQKLLASQSETNPQIDAARTKMDEATQALSEAGKPNWSARLGGALGASLPMLLSAAFQGKRKAGLGGEGVAQQMNLSTKSIEAQEAMDYERKKAGLTSAQSLYNELMKDESRDKRDNMRNLFAFANLGLGRDRLNAQTEANTLTRQGLEDHRKAMLELGKSRLNLDEQKRLDDLNNKKAILEHQGKTLTFKEENERRKLEQQGEQFGQRLGLDEKKLGFEQEKFKKTHELSQEKFALAQANAATQIDQFEKKMKLEETKLKQSTKGGIASDQYKAAAKQQVAALSDEYIDPELKQAWTEAIDASATSAEINQIVRLISGQAKDQATRSNLESSGLSSVEVDRLTGGMAGIRLMRDLEEIFEEARMALDGTDEEKDNIIDGLFGTGKQALISKLPTSTRQKLQAWSNFYGMQVVYLLSGKQINEREVDLILGFFSGPSALGGGQVVQRARAFANEFAARIGSDLHGISTNSKKAGAVTKWMEGAMNVVPPHLITRMTTMFDDKTRDNLARKHSEMSVKRQNQIRVYNSHVNQLQALKDAAKRDPKSSALKSHIEEKQRVVDTLSIALGMPDATSSRLGSSAVVKIREKTQKKLEEGAISQQAAGKLYDVAKALEEFNSALSAGEAPQTKADWMKQHGGK